MTHVTSSIERVVGLPSLQNRYGPTLLKDVHSPCIKFFFCNSCVEAGVKSLYRATETYSKVYHCFVLMQQINMCVCVICPLYIIYIYIYTYVVTC